MKVLHIFNEINFSGAELMYLKASFLFQEKGCELHAVSTGQSIGQIADLFEKSGYKVHHFPIVKSVNLISYFYRFNQFIKEQKFDVIHIHRSGYYSYFATIAKLNEVRCVRTIHSVFKHRWFTRWIGISNRFICKNILGVTFQSISPSVRENELKYYYNDSTLIYNWYDQLNFFPSQSQEEKFAMRARLGLNRNDFVIITVGRCVEEKRHNDIIEAIALVSKNSVIKFLHLGEGAHLNCEKLYAKKLNVVDHVIFAGNHKNVRDFLIAADVFVMTSRFEGLGNAAIEAMGCKIPLIVYDVPGLRDLVKNGINGYICPSNPEDLAKRIQWIYSNPDLAGTLAKNSYEFAITDFSMEKATDRIYSLYTS